MIVRLETIEAHVRTDPCWGGQLPPLPEAVVLASGAMIVEFAESYPAARGRFIEAVDAFESGTGRRCVRVQHAIVDAEDLTIDVAHFEPRDGRRMLLVTSGVHGIESYAGTIGNSVLPIFLRVGSMAVVGC